MVIEINPMNEQLIVIWFYFGPVLGLLLLVIAVKFNQTTPVSPSRC
jgi:hypothetical protein